MNRIKGFLLEIGIVLVATEVSRTDKEILLENVLVAKQVSSEQGRIDTVITPFIPWAKDRSMSLRTSRIVAIMEVNEEMRGSYLQSLKKEPPLIVVPEMVMPKD